MMMMMTTTTTTLTTAFIISIFKRTANLCCSVINELGEIFRRQDYCYDANANAICDKKMFIEMKTSTSNSFGEKYSKYIIVKPIITVKFKLRIG